MRLFGTNRRRRSSVVDSSVAVADADVNEDEQCDKYAR